MAYNITLECNKKYDEYKKQLDEKYEKKIQKIKEERLLEEYNDRVGGLAPVKMYLWMDRETYKGDFISNERWDEFEREKEQLKRDGKW